MKVRSILLSTALSFLSATAFAQIRYIPVAARSFSLSLGGGAGMLLGDFQTKFFTPVGRVNADYNFNRFVSLGLEGQIGRLTTSKIEIPVVRRMRVDNDFYAANANVRISWGKLFKPAPQSILNGFYLGAGAGFIHNDVTPNRSPELRQSTTLLRAGERLTGTVFIVPVNVGMDIDLSSFSKIRNVGINLNYQHSLSTDDHLDGFRVLIPSNKFPDSYGYLSVAVKYYFSKLK